jgi:dUTP pyrophosphatase
MKCQLEPHTYLKIVPRSSTPLKYWLVIANGEGIIDADYFNNPQNEGEIFLQLINLSPFPIKLQVGDCIAQGIICNYGLTINDKPIAIREGGFGSTTK